MNRQTLRYLSLIAIIFIAMAIIGSSLPQEWSGPLRHFFREGLRYLR